MRVKVLFRMKDRSEYEFVVEGDGQSEFYDLAIIKLREKLTNVLDTIRPLPEIRNLIESWRTIVESETMPGKDKADGVAVRSPLQKIRFDLLPVAPLTEVAKVFTFGAYQYGDRNWEEGFSWSRCIGSVWRHFMKWCLGEDLDDESGLHHLAHVIANCLFLLQYTIANKGKDDRQKAAPEFVTMLFQPINAEMTKKKEDK